MSQLQHVLELAYLKKQSVKTPTFNNGFGNSKGKWQGGGTKGKVSGSSNHVNGDVEGVKEANQTGMPMGQTGKPAIQQMGRPVQLCHHCKEPGHFRRECPKYREELTKQLASQSNCVQLNSVRSVPTIPGWLIDSGSTDHITHSRVNMLDYVKFDKPQFLSMANGNLEEIVGEGTVHVLLET